MDKQYSYRQRQIKRDLPENVKNILRVNRSDNKFLTENPKTNLNAIEEIQVFLNKQIRYKTIDFKVIKNMTINVTIPNEFDFFDITVEISFTNYVQNLRQEMDNLNKIGFQIRFF